MQKDSRITLRMPKALKLWLDMKKEEGGTSLNHEILNALKLAKRMDETKKAANEFEPDSRYETPLNKKGFSDANYSI